ncbi:hypothetical protein [Brevibacillus sp. Leaf182]|uniref:hypothetical protein n=1 Tax=Brevibacillus sp. Leaf182 TaxID=1736290 RepID=UPI0006F776C9|nr:hypothetical protein [Brevibacillus sp. Leaf182]RAT98752.1 hypothetical protein ASG16_003480 [Brevibacillus sp. Leaf182]
MNKKVALSILSATVVASMASSAFAAPKSGVYLGGDVDRYYELRDLFNLTDAGKTKFAADMGVTSFDKLIYVDFDGKGASLREIMNGEFSKVKRDLKKSDFEGVYTKANLDGTNGATYDPRNDAIDAPTGDLKVESVTAINATQVKVVFGVKVDSNDAIDKTNYSINGANPTGVELAEDGRTVTLTFASKSNVEVTDGVVVVEPVVTEADATKSTAKHTSVLTYEDTVKPEIVSATGKTNGAVATSVTVVASEPIQSSLAKINGTYYGIDFKGTATATINGLQLDATKPHTIELVNLTDKSENITVSTSKAITITVDANAPTAALSASSDKAILLTFDKAMDANSVIAAFPTNIGVKDEALADVQHGVVTKVEDKNDTQFLIPISQALYTNKDSRTLTVVIPNTIKDKLGNAVAPTTKTVVLSKDVTKPASTGYKVVKNAQGNVTSLEVNFSEGLAAGTPVKPTIVNENGVDVTDTLLGGVTPAAVQAGDKKVTLNFANPAKVAGKFHISFPAAFVTDQAETPNTSAVFNQTVDFGAGSASFDLAEAPKAAGNVITVKFGRAVKGGAVANSATDAANYTLAGKPLPADTIIRLNQAQDTATITLPVGSIEKTDQAAVFTVANVKAISGEVVTNYTGTVEVKDNVQPELQTAQLNADGSINLTFSETLAVDPDADDLVVTVNNLPLDKDLYNVNKISVGSDAGKYLLTVTGATYGNGTPEQADDVLYIDVNKNGAYDAATDILTSVPASVGSTVNLNNSSISSVKVGTQATPDTAKDAENNMLKGNTTKTVK